MTVSRELFHFSFSMTFPPEPFYFSLQYSQGHSLMSPSTSPFSTQGDLLKSPSTSPFYLANSTFTNWPIVDLLILFYIIIFLPSTLSKKVSHEPFYFSLEHSQGDSLMSPSTSLSQWHSLYNPFYFSLQYSEGDSLCPSTSPFSALREILFALLLLPSALSGRFSDEMVTFFTPVTSISSSRVQRKSNHECLSNKTIKCN